MCTAADFNMIEYAQRLTHYLPKLEARGVSRVVCICNGQPASCKLMAELVALPDSVELVADEDGALGRAYGVSRGWLADTDELELGETKVPLSPYVWR